MPASTLFQVKVYGAVVATPNGFVPKARKNSTLLIEAPLAAAWAVIVIFAKAVKAAPLAGLTMLAVGSGWPTGTTEILTGLEMVVAPPLSVALAVKEDLPAGGLFQVKLKSVKLS